MATGSYMTPIYSRSQSEVLGDLHNMSDVTHHMRLLILCAKMSEKLPKNTGIAPQSCDTFVALPPATALNCVVFGKNSDRPKGEVQEVVYFPSEDHPAGSKVRGPMQSQVLGTKPNLTKGLQNHNSSPWAQEHLKAWANWAQGLALGGSLVSLSTLS
ncbi:uncharacterized protein TNCV_1023421 [Trichonephila clavipes]|nr:uncharacterized protein TNCV_1023421 [Trichonephila clavipes]